MTRQGPVIKTVDNPIKVEIFIAGDLMDAEMLCQGFCTKVGLCVTVTPTCYAYRDGSEYGVIVGLINYPRFPTTEQKLVDTALDLAYHLMVNLKQLSFTVQGPSGAYFYSWREVDGYKGDNPW